MRSGNLPTRGSHDDSTGLGGLRTGSSPFFLRLQKTPRLSVPRWVSTAASASPRLQPPAVTNRDLDQLRVGRRTENRGAAVCPIGVCACEINLSRARRRRRTIAPGLDQTYSREV